MTVSRERFAMPGGGGGAWQRCLWAVAGPGRTTSRRAAPHISDQAPLVWRAPEGPAAVPVGGGGAWPGFETTRRAKLAARSARGRAAAHRHTQRPGPTAPRTPAAPQAITCSANGERAGRPRGGRRSGGAPSAAGKPAALQAPPDGEASELLVVLRVLVGLAAVGAAQRADCRHLLRRQ